MSVRLLLAVAATLTMQGCTSTFKTSKFDLEQWQPTGKSIEGVVYYEPHQVRITYSFTALTKDGALIGTAEDGACARVVQKQEIAVEPNFAQPRVLINVPGAFANSKLGLTLSNGMLTGVNTDSGPRAPEMIKEVTGFLKEAGVLTLTVKPQGPPACNAAPVITSKVPFT